MLPDDPRHGTRRGYSAHRRAGQDACQPCLDAAARDVKARELDKLSGRPTSFAAHQVTRRIQALVALGWTHEDIAERAGLKRVYVQRLETTSARWITPKTFHRISAAYEAMSMTLAPDSYGTRRARLRAQRRGYAPPLAWDNIDDENEQPTGMLGQQTRRSPDDLDAAMVDRLLTGQREPDATRAEKVAAMTRWLAWGRSEKSLCRIHGWHDGRYVPRERVAS